MHIFNNYGINKGLTIILKQKRFILLLLIESNSQKQRFSHPKMADLKAWSHGVRKANSMRSLKFTMMSIILCQCEMISVSSLVLNGVLLGAIN